QLVKFRTAQINALHGTLLEFGETIHKGRAAMEREVVNKKLATELEFFQYRFSDSFGGNPPLYSCGLSAL
ncbi:hypothetical protein CBL22_25895, partial [Shigella flexneri]